MMTVPVPMIPLTTELAPSACADWALVLDAVGIPYERRTTAEGSSLWVQPADHARAAFELQHYLRENRRPPAAPVVWPNHPHAIYGVYGYALVLIAVTIASVAHLGGYNWHSLGVLDAGFLDRGLFRSVLVGVAVLQVLALLTALNIGRGALPRLSFPDRAPP